VTPLSGRDRLDVDGLQRMIEHTIAGGVHGLFLLGTTGEAPSLSERLKRELIEQSSRMIDRRVPLLVGVTDTSLVDSIALTEFAASQDVDGIVAAPPPYFPLSQSDLRRYVEELAAGSPLPLFLYNMPSHSKVAFELETVRRLMQHPRVVGVKDSGGQMLFYNQLLQLAEDRPDFTVLMGPEELLAESVLMGGHGGVCGGANLEPALYVEQYEAAVTGDLRTVHKLQQRMMRLSSTLYQVGEPPSAYLTGLKCALSCVGLCGDRLAEPLHALSDDHRRQIQQHLRDLGIIEEARV
jgi:4-hydroxy-tetrahydrodipicolinate synthase